MTARRRTRWLPALLVLLLATRATATTVLPLDLGALTAAADRIVLARVERTDDGRDANGLPAVWTTFAVDEALKGPVGARLMLKQLGAALGAGHVLAGLPVYVPGERVVLFLHPDSRLGFSSPVGLGQGCFRIRNQDGRAVVENAVANRNLAPAATRAGTLPSAPLALADFLAGVRALVAASP